MKFKDKPRGNPKCKSETSAISAAVGPLITPLKSCLKKKTNPKNSATPKLLKRNLKRVGFASFLSDENANEERINRLKRYGKIDKLRPTRSSSDTKFIPLSMEDWNDESNDGIALKKSTSMLNIVCKSDSNLHPDSCIDEDVSEVEVTPSTSAKGRSYGELHRPIPIFPWEKQLDLRRQASSTSLPSISRTNDTKGSSKSDNTSSMLSLNYQKDDYQSTSQLSRSLEFEISAEMANLSTESKTDVTSESEYKPAPLQPKDSKFDLSALAGGSTDSTKGRLKGMSSSNSLSNMDADDSPGPSGTREVNSGHDMQLEPYLEHHEPAICSLSWLRIDCEKCGKKKELKQAAEKHCLAKTTGQCSRHRVCRITPCAPMKRRRKMPNLEGWLPHKRHCLAKNCGASCSISKVASNLERTQEMSNSTSKRASSSPQVNQLKSNSSEDTMEVVRMLKNLTTHDDSLDNEQSYTLPAKSNNSTPCFDVSFIPRKKTEDKRSSDSVDCPEDMDVLAKRFKAAFNASTCEASSSSKGDMNTNCSASLLHRHLCALQKTPLESIKEDAVQITSTCSVTSVHSLDSGLLPDKLHSQTCRSKSFRNCSPLPWRVPSSCGLSFIRPPSPRPYRKDCCSCFTVAGGNFQHECSLHGTDDCDCCSNYDGGNVNMNYGGNANTCSHCVNMALLRDDFGNQAAMLSDSGFQSCTCEAPATCTDTKQMAKPSNSDFSLSGPIHPCELKYRSSVGGLRSFIVDKFFSTYVQGPCGMESPEHFGAGIWTNPTRFDGFSENTSSIRPSVLSAFTLRKNKKLYKKGPQHKNKNYSPLNRQSSSVFMRSDHQENDAGASISIDEPCDVAQPIQQDSNNISNNADNNDDNTISSISDISLKGNCNANNNTPVLPVSNKVLSSSTKNLKIFLLAHKMTRLLQVDVSRRTKPLRALN